MAYFELMFPARKAFDERAILAEITRPLREEICIHKCQGFLDRLHVLDGAEPGLKGALSQARGASKPQPEGRFLAAWFCTCQYLASHFRSQVLQPVVFVEDDFIIREGEPAEAMYFVISGKVDVIKMAEKIQDEDTLLTTLGTGSIFGEVCAHLSSSAMCMPHRQHVWTWTWTGHGHVHGHGREHGHGHGHGHEHEHGHGHGMVWHVHVHVHAHAHAHVHVISHGHACVSCFRKHSVRLPLTVCALRHQKVSLHWLGRWPCSRRPSVRSALL